MALIYIVEDDENIRELISITLESMSYKTIVCDDYAILFDELSKKNPDLILLDIMLPNKNGFEIIRELKKSEDTKNIPVIFISAKGEELDKVKGLDLGAEDYITKPFGVLELQARVKTVLRRKNQIIKNNIFMDLEIDFMAKEIYKGTEKLKLTCKEFALFEYLYKNSGIVIGREKLLNNIWGYDFDGDTTRTVDMHIRSLRQKIGDDAENPKYIETVRGYGYKFRKDKGI